MMHFCTSMKTFKRNPEGSASFVEIEAPAKKNGSSSFGNSTATLRPVSRAFLFGVLMLVVSVARATEGVDVFTNLAQLVAVTRSNIKSVVPVRLNGVVYGVDLLRPGLALADEGGLIWIQMESVGKKIVPGSTVLVEGTMIVGKGDALGGNFPIIEGEYYSDQTEQVTRVYLTKGKHRLEAIYHQSTQRASLTAEYEGPGIVRQPIPNSAFFHEAADSPGVFRPGLKYECFDGYTTDYTDYEKVERNFTGTTTNLFGRFAGGVVENADRETKGPNHNYTLVFDGYLQINESGVYQFFVTADDGVRISIEHGSRLDVKVTGSTHLATPQQFAPSQPWGSGAEPAWAMTEGVVERVGQFEGQLQLGLRGDSGTMEVLVSAENLNLPAMLLNSRVRVTGIASSVTALSGQRLARKLFVPAMSEVEILKASEANWETLTTSSIKDLSHTNFSNLEKTSVQIRGSIAKVAPGKSFVIRDATGEIEVRNRGARADHIGQNMNVLGLPELEGNQVVLHHTVFRSQHDTEGSHPLLTSIEQIRRFKEAKAGEKYPVKFKGVVLQVRAGGIRGHVRGDSEAIPIEASTVQSVALKVGDVAEFEGVAVWDRNSPTVQYSQVTILGHGQTPEPLRPTWNELAAGNLDGQWIELQGVVLRTVPTGGSMTIAIPGGEISINVDRHDRDGWNRYLHTVVKIRGITKNSFRNSGQDWEPFVIVDSPLDITIVRPQPENLFGMATKRVPEIRAFDPNASQFSLIKIAGQIVHVRGSTVYLMDDTNGMRFTTSSDAVLSPGDMVEVVGIPEEGQRSSNLRNCHVRVLRKETLRAPLMVPSTHLNGDVYDSALVQFETTVLNTITNQGVRTLELQLNSLKSLTVRLDPRLGEFPGIHPQSRVRVTGVFTHPKMKGDAPPEVLLGSAADLVVVHTPPWWNPRRVLLLLGVSAVALITAVGWIYALRKRVERRTAELRNEVAEHKRTEGVLKEKTALLENEVEERKRMQLEVEKIHKQLVDASREAGQAEIAVNVLHNVGNVLNSVNISASVITDRVRKLHGANMGKAVNLLETRAETSPEDEKGKQLANFFKQMDAHLTQEQQDLLTELRGLGKNIEHIKEIVAAQQNYAKRIGVFEQIAPRQIVEDALKVQAASYVRHQVKVTCEFDDVPTVTLDKHKALQILVNLLQNAKQACDESPAAQKEVIVRIQNVGVGAVIVEVSDNGVGISPENLDQIFAHGFTTRKNGHGFGLHSSALAAKEMGGTLKVHSEGRGKGATFTVEIPVAPKTPSSIGESMLSAAA
jgi:signal transduction histidine kinase